MSHIPFKNVALALKFKRDNVEAVSLLQCYCYFSHEKFFFKCAQNIDVLMKTFVWDKRTIMKTMDYNIIVICFILQGNLISVLRDIGNISINGLVCINFDLWCKGLDAHLYQNFIEICWKLKISLTFEFLLISKKFCIWP
jgi:hypothetical protein